MNTNPNQAQFKVLNVEDDKFQLLVMSEMLQNIGVIVVECENGLLAQQELLKGDHHFDLILLNLLMPEMNGLELLKYLKNENQFKSIPVVITSSDVEAHLIAACVQAGAFYLIKPIKMQKLKQCIENVRKQIED